MNGSGNGPMRVCQRINDNLEKYPSRRQLATKTASASASFSISHSPGSAGIPFFSLTGSLWTRCLTPLPKRRIITY